MNCRTMKLSTPVGEIFLAANEKAIVALLWKREDLERIGIGTVTQSAESPTHPILKLAAKQLKEYFAGTRQEFNLPLELQGTPFQKRIWKELRKIPFGKTWSYQDLARRVDNPLAVRAVGTANGRNPICILIPCHRVVRLSGELGGYAGGMENKALLLDLEKRHSP